MCGIVLDLDWCIIKGLWTIFKTVVTVLFLAGKGVILLDALGLFWTFYGIFSTSLPRLLVFPLSCGMTTSHHFTDEKHHWVPCRQPSYPVSQWQVQTKKPLLKFVFDVGSVSPIHQPTIQVPVGRRKLVELTNCSNPTSLIASSLSDLNLSCKSRDGLGFSRRLEGQGFLYLKTLPVFQ